MTLTTRVEQRAEQRIFAGNDPAHTAIALSGLTEDTPALTVLMLNNDGEMVAWDGQRAGTAVGVLVLPVTKFDSVLTYWKSGTFATESLIWPEELIYTAKINAFVGSALSHISLTDVGAVIQP